MLVAIRVARNAVSVAGSDCGGVSSLRPMGPLLLDLLPEQSYRGRYYGKVLFMNGVRYPLPECFAKLGYSLLNIIEVFGGDKGRCLETVVK